MGLGLRFKPALAVEKKAEVTLRCLTDRAPRSGESWKVSLDGSLTGVRRGVRSGAGEDGGMKLDEGDGPRKISSSSSRATEESGGPGGERRGKRLYTRRGDWKTSSSSSRRVVGSACRRRGDGECMGEVNASEDEADFGGVRWKRGVDARQGERLESRFDCAKGARSAFGERSMAGGGQRKVGIISRSM